MKDYYQIFGVSRNSTQEEIEENYNKFKKSNQLSVEIYNIYHILNNTIKRKKYNELYDKINSLSSFKIPFFAYDFDEKYICTLEQKRYLISDGKYLIYDKETKNGKIMKNYYIEHNGKLDIISENAIKKLKEEYYTQRTQEQKTQEQKTQEQKTSEQKSPLLKETILNKVLPK
jgi:hypothetical protein